jgi:hypothetical protein
VLFRCYCTCHGVRRVLRSHKSARHQEERAFSRHKLATRNGACRRHTLSPDVRNAKAISLTLVNRFVFGLRPAVLDLPREDAGSVAVASPCRDPRQDDIFHFSNMYYQPRCSSTFWPEPSPSRAVARQRTAAPRKQESRATPRQAGFRR